MRIPRLLFQATLPLCCLGSTHAWAQTEQTETEPTETAAATTTTGAITGTTQTAQAAPLAGVSVVALHLPTGIRRVATTDATGRFGIDLLLAGGPYVLQITQPGFRSQVVDNVFLKAGQPVNLTFTLVPDVVAVGTRRATGRTALESVAPVDVVDMRALLLSVPQTDLTQTLNYVVPSFNSTRQTSADGADHVDPASLRGLAPDQMLVLVNGKRQHTTALINLLGNQGVGSVGYDLNTLAPNSLDRVEILRDGAAAQYGSDAIAGVMNLQLKNDDHGGNLLLSTGVHAAGDGAYSLLSANKGLKLGQQGFLNLTADANFRGQTVRNFSRDVDSWPVFSYSQAEEAAALASRGLSYDDFVQRNGDARIGNARAVFNAGVAASEKVRFYAFGGYGYRRGTAAGLWRLPASKSDQIVESIFPLGYQPLINTRLHDASVAAGAVFRLGSWSLDLSHVAGLNRLRYDVSNTLNASLGTESPTQFEAGGLEFRQNVSNATLSRLFPKLLAGTNLALGAEYRTDRYVIAAGEEASWKDYGRGAAGASGGAQGFIGFAPEAAVDGRRRNAGGFVDVEADVTKRWTVGLALRGENYSDFGSAFIYKASSRLQAASALALRAAFSTGFRAPSLQQELYRQLTLLPTATGVSYQGIFNNQSDVTRAAGIPALRPETSRNLSAGLVLTPAPAFTLTVDAYQININRRIVRSGVFGRGISPELDDALTRASADRAQFFTNALDTRTRGLDVVANYRAAAGRGTLLLQLAANANRTSLVRQQVPAAFQKLQDDADLGNNYIDQRQLSLLESGSPRSKVLLSTGYEIGKFGATVRNTYFGQVAYYDNNYDGLSEGSFYFVFRPKVVTDLMLSFRPAKALSLNAGVSNLFNVLPDTKLEAARHGHAPDGFASSADFNLHFEQKYGYPSYLPYDRDILPHEAVQMGFNGAFFYLKASYSFGQ